MFLIISYMHVLGVGEDRKKQQTCTRRQLGASCTRRWDAEAVEYVSDGDLYKHSQIVKSEQMFANRETK